MSCITKRDKAVLKAMLWRAKKNILRNKKGTCKSLTFMIILCLLVVAYSFLLKTYEQNIEAQNYITVTSSGNLLNGTNFFVNSTIQN